MTQEEFRANLKTMAENDLCALIALNVLSHPDALDSAQTECRVGSCVIRTLLELVRGGRELWIRNDGKIAYTLLDDLEYLLDAVVKLDLPRFERYLSGCGSQYPEISDAARAAYGLKRSAGFGRRPILSELFNATLGGPIRIQGKPAYQNYVRTFEAASEFEIQVITATTGIVQGLQFQSEEPNIVIDSQKVSEEIHWAGVTPDTTKYHVVGEGASKVTFRNCWVENGETIQRSGNAGIQPEELEHGIRLHCSAGPGDIDFTNLVVEIMFG